MTARENQLIAIQPVPKKFANIVWQVSDVCNYRCSYCNKGNWGGARPNLDIKQYIKTLTSLLNQLKEQGYDTFKIFFSGGEPTYWKPLIEICKFFHSELDRPLVAINTNMSRTTDWWEKNHHYFRDAVASFHIESADQEQYLRNIQFLQYRMPYVACRLLMHDQRFSEVVQFSERLKRELDNYVIEYGALFNDLLPHSPMFEYKDAWKKEFLASHSFEQQNRVEFSLVKQPKEAACLEIYSDGTETTLNATRLISQNRNHFKGWVCNINDSIFINTLGDIRLASCDAGRIVGNMDSGEVVLLSRPIVCPLDVCGCGTDINIPKKYLGAKKGARV